MIPAARIVSFLIALAAVSQPVWAGGLPTALLQKGCAQIDRGNYSSAISLLSTAVRQNPADLEARRQLSRAFIGAGMSREAVQQLEAIVRVAPGNANDLSMLAEAYFQAGDSRTAIARYRSALQVDPNCASACIGLANSLMATGDLKAARAHCTESLRSTRDPQLRNQLTEILSTIRTRRGMVQIVSNS